MKCNDVRENLIELLTGGQADPQVTAHLSQCSACTQELASMRKTMALEKAPAAKWVAWLRRPVLAVSLATAVAAGGLLYRLTVATPPDNGPGNAVADIESLDKNHDLILDSDLVNELTGAPSEDVAEP